MDEELLEAWIGVSTAIRNDKIVSKLTYNESIICNFLISDKRRGGNGLTAAYLCDKTQIQKSQMTRILKSMESRGLIVRAVDARDKRKTLVSINEEMTEAFEAQHMQLVELAGKLVEEVGEERAKEIVSALNDFAAAAKKVLG